MRTSRLLLLGLGLVAFAACKKAGEQGASSGNSGKADERPVAGRAKSSVEAILKSRRDRLAGDEAKQLGDRISSLSDQDLRQLLARVSDTRNNSEDRLTFTLAVTEFARREPSEVLGWFPTENMTNLEPGWSRVAAILAGSEPRLLEKWLLDDLSKAGPGARGECIGLGLQSLGAVDPVSALKFSKNFPNLPKSELINSIFISFGKQSPAAAEAAAIAEFKGRDLDHAYYNIAMAAGGSDPATGLAMASKISDAELRSRSMAGRFAQWLESDPAAAAGSLKALDKKDLSVALQSSPQSSNSLVAKIADKDPALLCELLGTVVISRANEAVYQAAVEKLTANHPEKAIGLVESIPEGAMKEKLFGAHFSRLAKEDLPTALASATSLKDGGSRDRVYQSIGYVVAAQGLDEVMKTAEALSAKDKAPFLGAALITVSDQDPKEAAALLAKGGLPLAPENKRDLLVGIGGRLGGSDAAYAKTWLASLPPEDQVSAIKGIAGEMAKSDLAGLASMLSARPEDKVWGEGVRVLIYNIRDSDPETAKEWQAALNHAGYK